MSEKIAYFGITYSNLTVLFEGLLWAGEARVSALCNPLRCRRVDMRRASSKSAGCRIWPPGPAATRLPWGLPPDKTPSVLLPSLIRDRVRRALGPSVAGVLQGLLLATAVASAGCGNKIGDDCRSSIDCSIDGDRSCDISQPGGYCTVVGCDTRSCPSDASCVRFFPSKFLTRPCDPATEDSGSNACNADEVCLESGLCAPRATERRYCVAKCGGNSDCRDGYECRFVGEHGSSPLEPKDLGRTRFCAPREPQ